MTVEEVLLLLAVLAILALLLGLSFEFWSQQRHDRQVMSASVLAALEEATTVARLAREAVEKLSQPQSEHTITVNPPSLNPMRELEWAVKYPPSR